MRETTVAAALTRPLYGLSAVFQVDDSGVTTVPGAPRGLSARPGTVQIALFWSAPATDGGAVIAGYKIEVSSDNGTTFTDLEADTGNDMTTYVHTGLALGDSRHYRVSAINANGAGASSNSASAQTVVPILEIRFQSIPEDIDTAELKVTLSSG